MQPGSNVGGIGMGVVRMVRPWNEWLVIWGYDINGERPVLTDDQAKGIIRQLVGANDLDIELTAISYWTVNNVYATHMQNARVFIISARRIGIRRRMAWGRTRRSRTRSIWHGNWRRC